MKKTLSRPTLEDIAREIQISRTTIYKVVNGKGTVSERTRQKVLDALEKYNYVPNNNARNLALNKKYEIALIDFESPDAAYFAPLIGLGVEQAVRDLGDHGLVVTRFTSPIYHPEQQLADMEEAYRKGIRHFIIAAADAELAEPAVLSLKERGCMVIALSKEIESASCDSFIGIDDYKSGQLAAELLGKMQPADGVVQVFVAKKSTSNHISTQATLQGFLNQMTTHYPSVRLLPPVDQVEDGPELKDALEFLLERERLTGIYDLTYRLDTICRVLKQRSGRHIALVGPDLFPAIEPFLVDRTIDAVIFQNLKAQSYLACKLLFEAMCYQKPISQRRYHAKLEIVMAENLEYFLNFEEM